MFFIRFQCSFKHELHACFNNDDDYDNNINNNIIIIITIIIIINNKNNNQLVLVVVVGTIITIISLFSNVFNYFLLAIFWNFIQLGNLHHLHLDPDFFLLLKMRICIFSLSLL